MEATEGDGRHYCSAFRLESDTSAMAHLRPFSTDPPTHGSRPKPVKKKTIDEKKGNALFTRSSAVVSVSPTVALTPPSFLVARSGFHDPIDLPSYGELCLDPQVKVADVILWRRKNVTIGILLGALASRVLFEVAGYTLLSLLSKVLLLLISILFLWSRSAGILNRPRPPIPEMHLSEEMMREAAVFVRFHVNVLLSVFNDIVHRKDTKLFYTIALCLWMISMVGGSLDILTLGYTSLVIILTVPALYEKYENGIDSYAKMAHMEVQMYERVYTECFVKCYIKARRWLLEKKKLLTNV